MPQEAIPSHRLVLFLAANPTNTQQLRLDEEVRAIRQQLQRSVLTLDSCWAVRPLDMQQEILRLKPQIVHFSGHGIGQEPTLTPDKRTLIAVGVNNVSDEEGLAFIEDATGRATLVDAEALASLFKNFQKYVKCVVLNGCYSAVQAEAIARHIPYVIGMKQAILDRAAIEFSKGFYNALAEGETIESAFEFGKTAIELTGMPDYQFPVLHKPKATDAHLDLSPVNLKLNKFRNKRWVMAGCILASLIGAIGIGILQLSSRKEANGLDCVHQARNENKLVVAIVDFQSIGNNPTEAPSIEVDFLDRLTSRLPPDIKTCPITDIKVSTDNDARKLGKLWGATLVLWGKLNPLALEVNITTVKASRRSNLKIPKANAQEFEILIQTIPEIVLLETNVALSYVHEDERNDLEARKILQDSLELLESKQVDLGNKIIAEHVGKAYSRLGTLYLSSAEWTCSKTKDDCTNALRAFKRASEIDRQDLDAFLAQANLYQRLENPKQAIEIYSEIIDSAPESEIALEARRYRAYIYLEMGDVRKAIADADFICKIEVYDYNWLTFLGKAQLQAGEVKNAESTFLKVKTNLKKDELERARIISELKKFSHAHSNLSSDVQRIIANLQRK